MQAYNKVIEEQRANGIIEEAPPVPQGTVHCLPHHCVVKPSKTTTKIRIVYDASAKASKDSLSLNDCLHRGPIFLSDLVGITIRLRLPKVALVSDIEKAFLQVGLQEDDRDVTRFLWLKDPSKPPSPSNTVTYRFCRVPFGVISSPFLLAATIAHHLRSINNPARSSIHNNVYVDNVFHGTQTDQQAFDYYTEAKRAFANASMNLREWHSNSKQFMDQIQQQDRGKTTGTSVLWLRWNLMEDTLQVNGVKPLDPSTAITKRRILEVVASVFDPCGFFSPVLITGKLLLQQLWREKVAWDEQVSEEIFNLWKPLADDLACIPACKLPRQLSSSVSRENAECELHCFCDASAKAYSAVIYLRIQSGDKMTADLIFSKSRSAPIQPKKLTIPRLELMAVLIGTRVLKYVATELRIQINAQYIWTDSCCVLHWILGDQVKTIFNYTVTIYNYNSGLFQPRKILLTCQAAACA